MAEDVSSRDTASLPAVAPAGGAVSAIAAEALATARGYAREALAPETLRAYAADWGHFSAWCATAGWPSAPPAQPRVVRRPPGHSHHPARHLPLPQ